MNKTDEFFMQIALNLATTSQGHVSPNPYVGALVVKNGEIIGQGYHHKAGTPHAEIHALAEAGDRAKNATLYVTLEPCCHFGRTGPCTEAIIRAGIKRVIIATGDPNPIVNGQGSQILTAHNIEVIPSICETEARFINRFFFHNQKTHTPYVTLKCALSLDGKISTQTFDSQWITGAAARKVAHTYRNLHDAILIGKQTLLHDNPQLTVRCESPAKNPVRILLVRHFEGIHDQFKLFDTKEAPTWIIHPANAPAPDALHAALKQKGVRLIALEGEAEITANTLLPYLYKEGIMSLMLEGGSAIYNLFNMDQCVQEYLLFYGPRLIGNRQSPGIWDNSPITQLSCAPTLHIHHTEMLEESLFVQAFSR